jgi:hypothetical protein
VPISHGRKYLTLRGFHVPVILTRWAGFVAAAVLATCLLAGRAPAGVATTAPESADLANPSGQSGKTGPSAIARHTDVPQDASNSPAGITDGQGNTGSQADPSASDTATPSPLTPVPEPTTVCFLAAGSGVLLWSAVRRRYARKRRQIDIAPNDPA